MVKKLMCICDGSDHEFCDKTCPHSKPHENRGGILGAPDCAEEVYCGKIGERIYCIGIEVEEDNGEETT